MRAFVAIVPPREVQDALHDAVAPLRARGLPIRWVAAESLHLTLFFLGNIDEGRVPTITAAIGDAAAAHDPADLVIAGVGAFPRRGDARVVWAGVEASDGVLALQHDVAGRLEGLGFPQDERAWSPHITLGRARRDAGRVVLPDAVSPFRFDFAVREIFLMRSHTGPDGARYDAVAEAPLGATAGRGV